MTRRRRILDVPEPPSGTCYGPLTFGYDPQTADDWQTDTPERLEGPQPGHAAGCRCWADDPHGRRDHPGCAEPRP